MSKRTGKLSQIIETSHTLDHFFKKKRSRLSDDIETNQEETSQEVNLPVYNSIIYDNSYKVKDIISHGGLLVKSAVLLYLNRKRLHVVMVQQTPKLKRILAIFHLIQSMLQVKMLRIMVHQMKYRIRSCLNSLQVIISTTSISILPKKLLMN